ncbi:zinc finger protein 816-like, partial [Thrips palmi]|uniref:Zinc finger protein 816-like n=1 Tax=Thrips palmi TaxID=161013 RepID=A0A6P8Y4Y2_THRPL
QGKLNLSAFWNSQLVGIKKEPGSEPLALVVSNYHSLSEPWQKHVKVAGTTSRPSEPAFRCGECGLRFRSDVLLLKHLRSHSRGSTFFKCDGCDKTFTRKVRLIAHKRYPCEAKPFTCNVCNKTYTRRDYIVKHQRLHAQPRDVKVVVPTDHECGVCQKKFLNRAALSLHQSFSFHGCRAGESWSGALRCDTCGLCLPSTSAGGTQKCVSEKASVQPTLLGDSGANVELDKPLTGVKGTVPNPRRCLSCRTAAMQADAAEGKGAQRECPLCQKQFLFSGPFNLHVRFERH